MENAPTHDAWRRALAEVEDREISHDPNVVTTAEVMQLLGINRVTAGIKLKKLIAAGRAALVKKVIRRDDGGIQTVPAYRLTAKALPQPDTRPTAARRKKRRQG